MEKVEFWVDVTPLLFEGLESYYRIDMGLYDPEQPDGRRWAAGFCALPEVAWGLAQRLCPPDYDQPLFVKRYEAGTLKPIAGPVWVSLDGLFRAGDPPEDTTHAEGVRLLLGKFMEDLVARGEEREKGEK